MKSARAPMAAFQRTLDALRRAEVVGRAPPLALVLRMSVQRVEADPQVHRMRAGDERPQAVALRRGPVGRGGRAARLDDAPREVHPPAIVGRRGRDQRFGRRRRVVRWPVRRGPRRRPAVRRSRRRGAAAGRPGRRRGTPPAVCRCCRSGRASARDEAAPAGRPRPCAPPSSATPRTCPAAPTPRRGVPVRSS